MNNRKVQSWFDLVVMPPMDPHSIIQTAAFEDSGGTLLNAILDEMKAAVNALIAELESVPAISSAVQKLLNFMKTH